MSAYDYSVDDGDGDIGKGYSTVGDLRRRGDGLMLTVLRQDDRPGVVIVMADSDDVPNRSMTVPGLADLDKVEVLRIVADALVVLDGMVDGDIAPEGWVRG